MNDFVKVLLGFIVGVAVTYLIMTYGLDKKTEAKEEVTEEVVAVESEVVEAVEVVAEPAPAPAPMEKKVTDPNVVWFDLTTAGGKEVRLHTKMPKDEVRQLLGKPAKTSVHQYGGKVHEEWEYEKCLYNDPDLRVMDFEIRFVDDLLESVSQY